MNRFFRTITYVASFSVVFALSACSGMQSTQLLGAPTQTPGYAHATFVVHWPSEQREASLRQRNAISPSTASITIAVNGGAPTVVNKPTLTGSPSTTSVVVAAPVGVDSFTFLAWDRAGGVGNILDKATTTQSIVANATNIVGVTLDGVCSALTSSAAPSSYLQAQTTVVPIANGGTQTVLNSLRLDGPFAQNITVNQVDPDGNTIVNSGGSVPIALNESGSTPHVTIAPASTAAGNNTFTLTPLVPEPDGLSTTITATSPNCGPGTASIPNAFTLSTSALVYVADSVAGIIAYDQDGNELAKITSTAGITGLTYNPSTTALIAVEPKSTTTGGVTFQTLSLTGTPLGSGTLAVPSTLENPVGNIAYNPANGYVLVGFREYTDSSGTLHYGSVREYSIAGSTGTSITPTGTNPFQPSSSAPPPYDVDSFAIYPNGNVVVGDSQSDSYIYDKNGNSINGYNGYTAATLAFDSLRGNVFEFVASQDYVYALNSTQSIIAEIYYAGSYNETVPIATAAAYSASSDLLYAFYGSSSFAVTGSSVYKNNSFGLNSLAPGAFPGLTSPTEALVVQ